MVIWFRDQIMPSLIVHEKLNFPMFPNAFHVLTKRLIIHALVETFSNPFFSFFWSSLFLLAVIWISSTMFFFYHSNYRQDFLVYQFSFFSEIKSKSLLGNPNCLEYSTSVSKKNPNITISVIIFYEFLSKFGYFIPFKSIHWGFFEIPFLYKLFFFQILIIWKIFFLIIFSHIFFYNIPLKGLRLMIIHVQNKKDKDQGHRF